MTGFTFQLLALLCTVLGLVSAESSGNIKLHKSCAQFGGIIDDIFNDIVNQTTVVHQKMRRVQANDPATSLPERTVVLNTFDSFFGLGKGGDVCAKNVIDTLDVVMNLRANEPRFTIYCSEDGLYHKTETNNKGGPIVESPGFQWIFQDPDAPDIRPQRMALGFMRCVDTAANGLIQVAYVSDRERIILCPSFASLPDRSANPHIPLPDGTQLDDQRSKTTTMFHELLHIMAPDMVGDQSGGVAKGGERYNFAGIHSLAGPPDSVRNPHSIAMYCLALWLGGNDWSTGVARPYPL
ncbi:uncharacterized protein BP5553_06531 [Venustampulla echinocandica]|uniref:Lysine-specific metallo-endopeptidase domain-containing protein n=1 Tax=Venustampulla echinocandica TaxID=2656787 RepID=A0A370TK67_9HELO|nr:uncharacterized protein BP5553_06531 [Venustampulla echinocandica]RDL35919.1 hypothetical protein BP5553_06531 [Venustampulla echinocandica]